MDGMIQRQSGQIDLDKLGQVSRQASDIQIIHHVRDDTSVQLHPRCDIGIYKMQWHFHMDLLI